MQYNYDYFISYAHADNASENDKTGFVDEFVEKLRDSEEHQQMFGGKIKVFFDKSEIHNMSDWDNKIRSSLASSRFLIVLLSPGYFKSEYCAREFDWWMQHEMHRRMLGEGTAPMLIVDVAQMYDYQAETIPDIPAELQARFPNWLSQIRKIQSGSQFDMHDLDRAKISDALDTLRNEVKDRVQRQDNAEKSPSNALYPRYNENFVGRRENLRSLRKSLSEKAVASHSALTGLGGFGKTELALTYGHAFAWDYQLGRIFVKSENKTSLTDILLSCGIAEMNGWELPKGTDQQKLAFLFNRLKAKRDEIVQRNLAKGNLNTLGAHLLLILDNVNNLELIWQEKLDILPDYFHVIITTRETPNEFPYINSEPVDRLSEDESVELLSNLRPFGSDVAEIVAARQIAQSLDGFTLVVELTGAYLARKPEVTYQQQYSHLITSHSDLFQVMADKTQRLARHSAETVAAVLESTLSALTPNARKALEFASLMAPDAVGFGWLPELLGLDEYEGKNILDELTGYTLLTPLENEPNIARIHRLVAETLKQKIQKENRKKIIAIIREKCNTLRKKDFSFWYASEHSWNIIPVFEFLCTLVEGWSVETSEKDIDWDLTWIICSIGEKLNSLGMSKEALVALNLSMYIDQKRAEVFPFTSFKRNLIDLIKLWFWFGTYKPPVSYTILANLSYIYANLGDIEKNAGNIAAARTWYEKTIETMLQLNEKLPEIFNMQLNLSTAYSSIGELEESVGNIQAARNWYLKGLKIHKRMANMMRFSVSNQAVWVNTKNAIQLKLIDSYDHLGSLEKSVGNVKTAWKWYEKSLAICQRLAAAKQERIKTLMHFSFIYSQFGDLECLCGNTTTARNWYKQGLEFIQKLVEEIPEHISTQGNLSLILKRLGDCEKFEGDTAAARDLYKKAMEILKQLFEKKPDDVNIQSQLANSYNNLGDIERECNNIDASLMWYEKAFAIRKQLADKSPDDVNAQESLSASLEQFGDMENSTRNAVTARERYKKALEIREYLSETMPEDIFLKQRLSKLYEKIGDLENADENIVSAQEWREKAQAINQWLTDKKLDDINALRDLSDSYEQKAKLELNAGNADAAKEWYEKALVILMQINEKMPEDDSTQTAIDNLKKYIFLTTHFTVIKWISRLLIIAILVYILVKCFF